MSFLPVRSRAITLGPPPYRGGQPRRTVGVRGADDGDGEAVVAVFAHQPVLAGDFFARVLPEWIGQRRAFVNAIVCYGFWVDGSGTDKHVLAGAFREESDIPFDLLDTEGDPVDDGVEGVVCKQRGGLVAVVDIALD